MPEFTFASMGSGRGDRNQRQWTPAASQPGSTASMGSGRGDRNQSCWYSCSNSHSTLQWGPVVVTGISGPHLTHAAHQDRASMGSGRGDRNQVVLHVRRLAGRTASMGSGRGDRNQGRPDDHSRA